MEKPEGWQPDSLGQHEVRWFSDGQPTTLVRDGKEVTFDDVLSVGTARGTDTSDQSTHSPQPQSSPPSTAAADWYPDPGDTTRLRFWDGSGWTGDIRAVAPDPTPRTMAPSAPVWTQHSAGNLAVAPQLVQLAPPKTNGYAIASLVLGLVPVIPVIGSILAIIFGILAESQVNGSGGTERGRGMAIAGTILGVLGIIGFAIIVWIAVHGSTNPGS